jgi:hypothetical protein
VVVVVVAVVGGSVGGLIGRGDGGAQEAAREFFVGKELNIALQHRSPRPPPPPVCIHHDPPECSGLHIAHDNEDSIES